MFEEIATGVFSVDHQVVEGKNGVVLGRRGAVAIDGGNYPEEGQAVAEFLHARGYAPRRLVLTHGHGDHILGGGALADGEVFAHANTPAVIRRQIPGWAARSGETEAQVAARLVWPTVTFSHELDLDLGDRTLHLFPTPGHSEDGVCVYLPETRILFAGDAVVTGIVPAIGDGDSAQLEASLRALAELPIAILVSGHGPLLRGSETIRDWLGWLVGYLAGIRAFVQGELARGQAADAVADAAEFHRFVGDRLPADRHGMPRRHRATVEKIVEEQLHEAGAGRDLRREDCAGRL
jgi:cyclase